MNTYNRNNPCFVAIKERYSLCKPGSKKNTQHIVLDLHDTGLTYAVGDSIGICPQNDPETVQKTLKALHATGEEVVTDRQGNAHPLRAFLTSKGNISDISRKLLNEIASRQGNETKKRYVEELLQEEKKEELKNYLETHHVWDFLLAHSEVRFSPQEFVSLLMPLLPRLYSIASSQNLYKNEVHLTVALLEYVSNGHSRLGVCTNYLCHLAPLQQNVIPVYIQPHHGFTLPQQYENKIIMVGPGTGVAPFRAFMQERMQHKTENWLFFGEWNAKTDFFYETFWRDLEQQGLLRISTAFSRDQEHKVYVQHQMKKHGKELFHWLKAGAYFYVCGDAKNMARDVETTLLKIIEEHGNKDEEGAKQYLKQLRTDKRYLKDVY